MKRGNMTKVLQNKDEKVLLSVALVMMMVAVLLLSGCNGGVTGKADPSKADIGKKVTAGIWEITLIGIPEIEQVVGGEGFSHQAENGQFVIVPVDVTNIGSDVSLFPDDLIFLQDSAGKQWSLSSSTPQFAYKQTHPKVDILMDSPVSPGETRHTVLIFDVSVDSSGFILVLPSENIDFDLGY